MVLEEEIKAEAHRLGFQLVGITSPDPPPHLDVYENWLAAGRHGEMGYLATPRARARRADPREILPECRSILVLGMRYPAPPAGSAGASQGSASGEQDPESLPPGERALRGSVAAYAWGEDYHGVLPERLRDLLAFIEVQVGRPLPNRVYTDTGPLLERELAQRAGLGWIGVNTCLIHPRHGSHYLLAEVLLGLELRPDPPFEADRCGTCTRCLEACPTACILPDRTLDARRCISYLTIELKGPIPLDLRPLVGEWVFGCDACQQVCPWNLRFARPDNDPVFAPRPDVPAPDLRAELDLTAEGFNQKFKGSPVRRARRRGYLRNIAVALGNTLSPATVPGLVSALRNDPEPLVRGHAAWALGRIGSRAAQQALASALESEPEAPVQDEIRLALQEQAKTGEYDL